VVLHWIVVVRAKYVRASSAAPPLRRTITSSGAG
jgi:hypothetical protein